MKKVLFFAMVCTLVLAGGCKPKGVGPEAIKGEKDSAEYFVGYTIGMQMKMIGMKDPINFRTVNEGIQAAFNDVELDASVVNTFMTTYTRKLHEIAAMEAEQREFQYLSTLRDKDPEVQELMTYNDDGTVVDLNIYYKVLEPGDPEGIFPTEQDTVVVDYEGRLINGKVFDSTYKRGEPAEFPLDRVIRGWTLALQQMPVGAKWTLYIPSIYGYGNYGSPMGDIGPNETLIFDVELLDVKPAVE